MKLFYGVLKGSTGRLFPWKSVWGSGTLLKLLFFVWIASWGKILTTDNLMMLLEFFGLCQVSLVIWKIVGMVCLEKMVRGKILNGFLHFLAWLVWRERNDRTFNGVEKSVMQMQSLLFRTSNQFLSGTCVLMMFQSPM